MTKKNKERITKLDIFYFIYLLEREKRNAYLQKLQMWIMLVYFVAILLYAFVGLKLGGFFD